MDSSENRGVNQAAYRRLKETIDRTYPKERFVAIADGQLVADAGNFADLRSQLRAQGRDPDHALIVQSGQEYPERVTIFLLLRRDHERPALGAAECL